MRSARTFAVVGLLAVGLLLAACGVPGDAKARTIDREALPPQLVSTSTTSAPSGPSALNKAAKLFLVRTVDNTDVLAPTIVDIVNAVDPADLPRRVIEELINQQPKDTASGDSLTNSIPSTVRVLDASMDGNVLDLNLSDLGSVELTRQRLAAAQIVFTATDLQGVDAVRFSFDGEPGAVPLDDQASAAGQAIMRRNYPTLLAALGP